MSIVWLGDGAASDPGSVGGKCANLSKVAESHPVPPGFCLTTHAFERAQPEQPLPQSLQLDVAAAYRTLAKRCGTPHPQVAVRSSAVDEDGATASFAGQHDTFLNVVGPEAVCEAVVGCWRSAFTPQVLAYRRSQGVQNDQLQMAVLVQQLIPADASMVLFSANPVTGSTDEMMINANWGLGESVVSGAATPDTYTVSKLDGTIVRHIGEKALMTVLTPQGTQEANVPRVLRTRAVLEDEQVHELVQLGKALETQFGWPVDVECAYHQRKLYLLQCRPITTLSTKEDVA